MCSGYIPYMTNYEYCCSACGTETILKKPASKSTCTHLLLTLPPLPLSPSPFLFIAGFIQVMITTLANLQTRHASDQPPKIYFSLEDVHHTHTHTHTHTLTLTHTRSFTGDHSICMGSLGYDMY